MNKTLTTLLFIVSLCTNADAEHFDVFLLAGQSNMDGRGNSSDLTEAQRGPLEDAIIFYRNASQASDGWQLLTTGFSVPPKFKRKLPSPTFGPEIGFAHAMLKSTREAKAPTPMRKLAIIKCSKGGTNLRKDWHPGTHGEPDSQGPQYRDMIETIKLASSELTHRGDTLSIRGLLWHQGESDSKSSAERHQERLLKFITRVREDTQLSELPVVVGQVFDNGRRNTVRKAIQAVGQTGQNVGFVFAKGLTTWDEGTHFDAASQWELGQRFARQLLRLHTRDGEDAIHLDKRRAAKQP